MPDEYLHPMDRRDPDYLSAAEESRQEINEHLERASRREAPRCPSCGLVMSNREASEQGACNDCSGGAYWPNH
jgi:ribosomal protein L37AE/L43A